MLFYFRNLIVMTIKSSFLKLFITLIVSFIFFLYFQTHAEFEMTAGVKSLISVKRMCDLKHSSCNNACAEQTTNCWLCCNDNANCNGFPLRSNLVSITSSAPRQLLFSLIPLVLATVWLFITRYSV